MSFGVDGVSPWAWVPVIQSYFECVHIPRLNLEWFWWIIHLILFLCTHLSAFPLTSFLLSQRYGSAFWPPSTDYITFQYICDSATRPWSNWSSFTATAIVRGCSTRSRTQLPRSKPERTSQRQSPNTTDSEGSRILGSVYFPEVWNTSTPFLILIIIHIMMIHDSICICMMYISLERH